MSFEDLGLSPELLKAIAERGYNDPTPIQAQAIPQVLMMRDVMGLAQTGTGKTASFILPMIEVLHDGRARARMPRSLILEPTRELAAQVAENFDIYGKYHKLSKALLVGGESMMDQQRILERGVDVLIATPGRLLDLFERGNILLNDIKILVIDEADRMLDMGFVPDIEKIISRVPPQRQTLLFSATMPPEIKKLSEKFLSNPKHISVAPAATTSTNVYQGLVMVHPKEKRKALESLIRAQNIKNAFVFCNRKRDIDDLTKWLNGRGFKAASLHGDMVQSARYDVLNKFKVDEITVLVCSDVAARGLDVAGVSHVFNYDVPFNSDDYVHRIGRTGRAGLQGHSFTLATPEDAKFVASIQKLIKKDIPLVQIEGINAPTIAEDGASTEARSANNGDRKQKGRNRREKPKHDKQAVAVAAEKAPEKAQKQTSEVVLPAKESASENATHSNTSQPQRQAPAAQTQRQDDGSNRKKSVRVDGQNREIHQVRSSVPREERHPRRYRDEDDGINTFGDDIPAFLRR
jgi:superfamily II DNA/RNA helicase